VSPSSDQSDTASSASRRRALAFLDLSGFTGLTDEEARARLESEGPNELPAEKGRSLLRIALEVLRQPMFLMLVAAGSLYLFMGELTDALMLLGFVFVVMGITVVQERRTERALEALRDLSSPRALVIRGGAHQRIAGREVVRGDILILSEGDRVPADAVLRRGINLSVDESLLTGESVPVRKAPSSSAESLDRPGGDDLPSLFSGTLVTAGQGVAEVLSTGALTELGKIGKALQQVEPEATLLQKETGRLVRLFAAVGLSACALMVVAYGLTRGGDGGAWKDGLLAGISLAMATLPEEFPVVLTVFLALGAWRISRSRVLTRRMPAVETLGAATVLCVDKTGTLTMNQMTLGRLVASGLDADVAGISGDLPGVLRPLLEHAVLASRPDPFDPMERAIRSAGDRMLGQSGSVPAGWALAREYPLSTRLLAVTQAWSRPEAGGYAVASKGAPEAIAELCRMTPAERAALATDVEALASAGLRVLGVAGGEAEGDLPDDPRLLSLQFVGLIGLEDPLRPAVPGAVIECRRAGIRVVMITGDYPVTAQSIARQAGLESPEKVLTGPEIDQMSDEALAAEVARVSVFARVVPEQKLRLVNAFKANREIVAMTGDGVNDAPALKAAHIGIAMGGRGTDVARESASLILLDDDFSSIVAAVRLGRRIFDNIKKAVAFIFAVHVPIAGLSVLPVFIPGWPLLLLPVHIVFLELIIDPSCTLVFEGEAPDTDIMERPPRDPRERLFSSGTIGMAVLEGLAVLGACVAVYMAMHAGHTPETARAAMFTTLVAGSLVIILANRSWVRSIVATLRTRNPALLWVLAGTAVFLTLALATPVGRHIFRFGVLSPGEVLASIGAGAGCLIWFELLKLSRAHRRRLAARSEG
jgi:Ca2+-transporting ATPase